MAENEDNSSAYKNRGYSKTSQIVIQNEVKDLFYKFNSLREETHKEFSTIINGHSESISKGIDDLVEEELQAQVSIIAHERNVLLETVANLNSEIRKLSARLPTRSYIGTAWRHFPLPARRFGIDGRGLRPLLSDLARSERSQGHQSGDSGRRAL